MERVKDSWAGLFLHVQEQVLVLMNYNEEESESVWNILISFLDIFFLFAITIWRHVNPEVTVGVRFVLLNVP